MIKEICLCWVDEEDRKTQGNAKLYIDYHDSIKDFCDPMDPEDIKLGEIIVLSTGEDYVYLTEDTSKEKEEQVKKMLRDKMLADLFYMSSELMGNRIGYVDLSDDDEV